MPTRMNARPNLQSLLNRLKHNAISAIQQCRAQYEKSEKAHHECVYDVIGFVAAFVAHLRGTPSEARKFLADEYWVDKPYEPQEKNLVRLATMYALGAKESKGALYQQAVTYTKVVEHFLKAGTDPIDIPGLLKQETIYKLIERIKPKAEEEQPAVEAADQRQVKAKDAKADDAVRSPLRNADTEVVGDAGGEGIDSDEGEAEAAEPGPDAQEGAPANTTPDDEEDDLLAGAPDLRKEQTQWERNLIKRARAIWKEGYEVLLVSMPKVSCDTLMAFQGDGYVELKCEYARSEDWQAVKCLHIRPL